MENHPRRLTIYARCRVKICAHRGEALAVADVLDKARHFVLGCSNLTIAVDHRPLIKIFGDRSLDEICNARLRNLKEKTLRYRFKMVHIPGIKNRVPDALSRHPSGPTNPPKMTLQDDVTSPVLTIPTALMAGIITDEPRDEFTVKSRSHRH